MWLSGLHIPESFLTALVQMTCRRHGWPLDRSTLYTSVTEFLSADMVEEKPVQVSYILFDVEQYGRLRLLSWIPRVFHFMTVIIIVSLALRKVLIQISGLLPNTSGTTK